MVSGSGVGKIEFHEREKLHYAMLGLTFGADCFVAVGDGVMVAGVIDVGEAMRNAESPSGSNPYASQSYVDREIAAAIEEAVRQARVTWGGDL